MKRSTLKKVVTMVLAAAVIMSVPVNVSAKTTSVKASSEALKPKSVKTGSYKVTLHKGNGYNYLAFRAPSAGKYRVKIGNLTYKNEAKDMQKSDYGQTYNEKYKRETSLSIERQINSTSWRDLSFKINGKKQTIFDIGNSYSIISSVYLGKANYDIIAETADAIINEDISESEVLEYTHGRTLGYELDVKMDKGAVIKIRLDSDPKSATTVDLKISKVKK